MLSENLEHLDLVQKRWLEQGKPDGDKEFLLNFINELLFELTKVEKYLKKYGSHTDECALMWDDDDYDPSPCTCGYEEIIDDYEEIRNGLEKAGIIKKTNQ